MSLYIFFTHAVRKNKRKGGATEGSNVAGRYTWVDASIFFYYKDGVPSEWGKVLMESFFKEQSSKIF